MRYIGCDLHASQQSIAMLDRDTGVVVERTLNHEGGRVREFYASIPPPVVVGIEATGSMGWCLRLMEELAFECRVQTTPSFSSRLMVGAPISTGRAWDVGSIRSDGIQRWRASEDTTVSPRSRAASASRSSNATKGRD